MLLERRHILHSQLHCLFLENLTSKQQQKIKNSIIGTNNHLNGIFPSFNSLNSEFYLEFRLSNFFSSCFLFYKADCYNKESKVTHCKKLDELIFNTLSEPNIVIVVSDTSIGNNIAIYVHFFNNLLKKIHYQYHNNKGWAICYQIQNKLDSSSIWLLSYYCHHRYITYSIQNIWLFYVSISTSIDNNI